MAKHKITLTLDGDTLTAHHRTTVEVAGHAVSHSEDVELEDRAGAAAALRGLVDANREEMEKRAQALAIEHVAALSGKVRKGQKRLTAGGTLGVVGKADAKKAEG